MRRRLEGTAGETGSRHRSPSSRAHPDARRRLPPMMRIRLRLLLTSFNKSVMEYALARLEVAQANPAAPAPPVLNRLGPYAQLDQTLAGAWPAVHAQVGAAADYIAAGNGGRLDVKRDLSWSRLERAVKLAVQFAESIDWIGVDPRTAAGEEGL
jgi:hypothetical protein